MRPAKEEKSGFRSAALSQWHRDLGYDFPATDLDFPLLEYHHSEPCALIEYKPLGGQKLPKSHPTLVALGKFATRAGVPFFLVRFSHDFEIWQVTPMNALAEEVVERRTLMSETVFKKLLSSLRNPVENPAFRRAA